MPRSLFLLVVACCLPSELPAHAESAKGCKVSTELKFEITAEGDTHYVVLDVLLPKTEPGRQKITALNYSKKPQEIFEKEGQLYAQFLVRQFPAELTIGIEAEAYRYDLTTARTSKHRALATKDSLQQWLVHEQYLDKYSRVVWQAAKANRGATREATVRSCFDYVVANMKKTDHTKDDVGAAKALFEQRGDCTEFADVFIALCRANDIPARFCEGYLLSPVADTPKHDWAEVYFNDLGWVPFDPSFAQSKSRTTFDEMRPIYLQIERQRRNNALNLGHFWYYRYEGALGSSVAVKDTFTVKSREDLP